MKDHKLTERRVRAWLAARYGVISRQEALAMGLTTNQIAWRVQSGVWEVVCPGVYHLAGAPMTPLSRLRVAVLAGGAGSAVSHKSAAWLWGIASAAFSVDSFRDVTITVPHGRSARIRGIRTVRSRH